MGKIEIYFRNLPLSRKYILISSSASCREKGQEYNIAIYLKILVTFLPVDVPESLVQYILQLIL